MLLRLPCCLALLILSSACSQGGGSSSDPTPIPTPTPAPTPALAVLLAPPATPLPILGARAVFQETVSRGSTVLAADAPGVGYQWLRDGQELAGATSAQLVLDALNAAQAGSYQVRVTEGGDTVTSAAYALQPVDRGWVVTSLADSGSGSLRAVLAQANAAAGLNGIRFQLGTAAAPVLTLASDLPPVTGQVCILGPAPLGASGALVLDGGGHRPFFVDGGTLLLAQFTVRGGLARGATATGGGGAAPGLGGGLFINRGAVALRQMLFQGNRALGGAGGAGGDGSAGGGAGFGGANPATGGTGAGGGLLGGVGGAGVLDGVAYGYAGDGDGAGGGAVRGGLLTTPVTSWAHDLQAGDGAWAGGGGFSLGPRGGGGNGGFGGGGGGSGGSFELTISAGSGPELIFLPGAAGGESLAYGGDGGVGAAGVAGYGGGGAGLGGAVFLRDGTLDLVQCQFLENAATGGAGGPGSTADPLAAGDGKGGAVFIRPFGSGGPTPGEYLALLQAQTFRGNVAVDLPTDASDQGYDNADFYIATRSQDLPQTVVQRAKRLARRLQAAGSAEAPSR
jgi:hypothetical protein